jgi:hypothetical protein
LPPLLACWGESPCLQGAAPRCKPRCWGGVVKRAQPASEERTNGLRTPFVTATAIPIVIVCRLAQFIMNSCWPLAV